DEEHREGQQFDHEHRSPAVEVGQAAESQRTDENAGERCCAHDALLRQRQAELLDDQGSATPVMKTTLPSKNLPAEASSQIRHCLAVIATNVAGVPSRQDGVSSM